MAWELNAWGLPGFVFFAATWAIAWVVYRARPGCFQNRMLAVVLALEGMVWLLWGLESGMQEAGDVWALRVTQLAFVGPLAVAYLGFLGTLDTPLAHPLATRTARQILLATGLVAAGVVVASPWTLIDGVQPVVYATWDVDWSAAGWAFHLPWAAALLFGLVVAVSLHRRAPPASAARVQAGIYAGAFGTRDMFWAASFPVYMLTPYATDLTLWSVGTALQYIGFGVYLVLLPYGFLRHQLLGIDVKVKWTIKQSTVAAVFLAVIFLVSEGAQVVFGEDRAWLGLVAGGVLVFALTPLQRFAERVSDKAMPGVKPVQEMSPDERRRAYEEAAATAWSDGAIDVSERALLDRFRESLGLNEDEAHRIESRAAEEVA